MTAPGPATTGTDAGVTITGDPADGIYPGGEAAVTVNVDNYSATQSQRVKYLHVEIDPVAAGCDASWFTFQLDEDTVGPAANPYSYLLDDEIAGGDDADYAGKVFMSNPNVDQDACKTSDLTLNYDISNTP